MVADVRDRGNVVAVACAAAIAVVAWPVHSLRAGVGNDWSWVSALDYVAEHGMRFGDQIVWTYGPLGFLDTWYGPVLYYGDVLLLSWLYVAALQLLLAYALLVALRRTLPLLAAAVAAAAVLALSVDLAPALAFAWCALALTRDEARPRDGVRGVAFPLALGALTGIAVLGKLNQGAELVALAVVTLLADPRRRDALAFAGSLLAVATVGWFATGQTLADAWPYVRNGVEMVAGYAAAMGASDQSWSLAAALLLIALALALAWHAAAPLPRRRRWGVLALYAVYSAFAFKEGFVRQDPGHLEAFFGDMLVPLALLPPTAARRVPALALAAAAASLAAVGALSDAPHVLRRLNPVANATAAADQVRTLASSARQDAVTADLRARVDALYQLSPPIRAAVGQRAVMPWPFVFGEVAYAYGLDLRPLPVLEPYGAYTPALDRLAARMLVSERAPARILRANATALDERHTTFEAPLATRAIFCRYRQLAAQEPWQVLAPAGDRCGAPRALGTRSAAWAEPVQVPAPRVRDALVLVRVEGADPQGLERLRALVLRPRPRWIALDGQRHRLVAATAADGLLLSAPPRLDYPPPFAMAPRPRTIAVGRDDDQPGGALSYRFEEVPLRPVAAVARAP